MSDLHSLPLLSPEMPWQPARASVYRDEATGLWCWEHQCPYRLRDKPYHSVPAPSWGEAYGEARVHMGLCP